MKTTKMIISVILAIVILGSLAVCSFGADVIGTEKAKSIALNHAGLSASDVTFTKAQLDYDDGTRQYEIEFYAGVYEYDYDINAYNGNIRSYDKEYDDDRRAPVTAAPSPAVTNAPSQNYIGVEAAKSAALSHAGVAAADAKFVKAQLDYDDGIAVYDVDFYSGSYEYDYEINAVTGKVISFDADFEGRIPAAGTTAAPSQPKESATAAKAAPAELIGVDKAKEIALNHAGLSASDVKFRKASLDYDDGIAHYDIEFRVGLNKEYDYEIDGITGAITDYDYDYDRMSVFSFFSSIFGRIFGK